MFGPLALLAASISPVPPAHPPVSQTIAPYRPATGATAHATASITIISGVRFGEGPDSGGENAIRRTTRIREQDGIVRPAYLLEFQ